MCVLGCNIALGPAALGLYHILGHTLQVYIFVYRPGSILYNIHIEQSSTITLVTVSNINPSSTSNTTIPANTTLSLSIPQPSVNKQTPPGATSSGTTHQNAGMVTDKNNPSDSPHTSEEFNSRIDESPKTTLSPDRTLSPSKTPSPLPNPIHSSSNIVDPGLLLLLKCKL